MRKKKKWIGNTEYHIAEIEKLSNKLLDDDLGLNPEEAILVAFLCVHKGIKTILKVKNLVKTLQNVSKAKNW